MKNLPAEQIADLRQSLVMPADIQIADYLGSGARAHVFKAMLVDVHVVVKLYREQAVQKYRQKYDVDIAEFEYERNQSLVELAAINKYIAKPYRLYSKSSEYSHCIVQEQVLGKPLKEIVNARGGLPNEILTAGYEIVNHAEANGIHDLDISYSNMMVVEQDGVQIPKLYDFNLLPQHIHPPNPFLGLAIKLGLRAKSHRDYRNLKKWERHGENAARHALQNTKV